MPDTTAGILRTAADLITTRGLPAVPCPTHRPCVVAGDMAPVCVVCALAIAAREQPGVMSETVREAMRAIAHRIDLPYPGDVWELGIVPRRGARQIASLLRRTAQQETGRPS